MVVMFLQPAKILILFSSTINICKIYRLEMAFRQPNCNFSFDEYT